MRGIEIDYNRSSELVFKKLLDQFNLEDFEWYIVQSEIISNNDIKRISSNKINGKKFSNLISAESYFVYFVNIQVYNKNSSKQKIEKYCDFINSNCEMIILISDCDFIEVYTKTEEFLYKIINNVIKHNLGSFRIKTDESDCRNEMFV